MTLLESPEDVRDAVVRRTEEAVTRVTETADDTRTRLSKASRRARRHSADLGDRARLRAATSRARIGVNGSRLGAKGVLFGARTVAREKLRPARDAKLRAELVRTSRELANETSDLGAAVNSLNEMIRENRKAGAAGRRRLIVGIIIGAAASYHLDADHGHERRAASARLVKGLLGR
jgi:hypothetical protein